MFSIMKINIKLYRIILDNKYAYCVGIEGDAEWC